MLLAPWREKKGEFTELFANVQARVCAFPRGRRGGSGGTATFGAEETKSTTIGGGGPREGDAATDPAASAWPALRLSANGGLGRQWPRAGAGDGHGQSTVQQQVCLSVQLLLANSDRACSFNSPLGACPPATAWARRWLMQRAWWPSPA